MEGIVERIDNVRIVDTLLLETKADTSQQRDAVNGALWLRPEPGNKDDVKVTQCAIVCSAAIRAGG